MADREFLENCGVREHLRKITESILRDRPAKDDIPNYIATLYSVDTERTLEASEKSTNPTKRTSSRKASVATNAASHKDSAIIVDREPLTSDLTLFDELLELVYRNRTPDSICRSFWTKLRNDLEQFATPLGYPVQDQPDDIVSLDKYKEVCQEGCTRIIGTERLLNLSPILLAADYELSENEVLGELLFAAKAGLVKMSWSGECPRCGGNAGSSTLLGDVPHKATCPACDLDTDYSSLDQIKIVFVLIPSVFYAPYTGKVCNANPDIVQYNRCAVPIFPNAHGHGYRTEVVLPKGKYHWFCPHCKIDFRFEIEADLPEDHQTSTPSIEFTMRDSNHPTKPAAFPYGKLDVTVWPDSESTMLVCIFEDKLTDEEIFQVPSLPPFTSASTTINHPVFQELFSSQVVSTTQRMSIESVTLAFTDIVGSTATYARLGDGMAMAIVQTHFDYLFDEIRKRDGRVVKTVGDAVMASFVSSSMALEAFVAAIQSIQAFNKSDECPKDTVLQIRVGLHSGSAIVVPLNGINDYFGQTVNTAARIEGKSKPNTILVTEAVLQAPSAKAKLERLVKEGVVSTEEVEPLELKGVKDPVKATLLTVIEKPA